jgi:RNA polymerase sigma-70 factor (ECF subfamily)
MSDSALMSRVAVGEEAAVTPLLRRYEKPLLALLSRLTGCRTEADDLFQDTWIRVIRFAGSYDPSLPFRPWLFRIAWNVARTWLRRARPEEDLRAAAGIRSNGPFPGDDLLLAERRSHIHSLVRSLPGHLSETVFLRFFEELSEREVANRLGIPIGTVKSRVHNAIRQLAVQLQEDTA